MKKRLGLFLLSLLAVLGQTNHTHADLAITQNNGTRFSIIVPALAPASITAAASELQRSVALATNATLAIHSDNERVSGPFISLGATTRAQAAGISAKGIADSGFRFLTRDGNLYIIGPDTAAKVNLARRGWGDTTVQPDIPGPQHTPNGGWSNGTANGVYTFLEKYLGVRWLFPGDLGRDVPARSSFVIPDLDSTETSPFIYRHLGYLEMYPQSLPSVHAWQERQKLGYSFHINHNHSWAATVPKEEFARHPEWFAMINGVRVPPGDRFKLETTNQDLVEYFADKAVQALQADPALNTYSLSPNDSRGWSESPESKAFYDPSPSTVFDPEAPPGPPSITPLMLKWYRDVSNAVARKYPQGKLAGYLYSDYLYPPLSGDMTLPDNFIPVIAPSFDYGYRLYRPDVRDKFDYVMTKWSQVAPPTWFYYDLPNQIMEPWNTGIITPPGTSILNHIFPRLLNSRIKGAVLFGNTSWTNAAMTNYIDAKLLWDPTLDANTLQHEWLQRAYGAQAGTVMEQLYGKLEQWFATYYQQYNNINYSARETLFRNVYAAHYAEIERDFLLALQQPMTSVQRQRLQMLVDNLIVLQWRLRNVGNLPASFSSSLQRNGAEIEKLLFQQNSDFTPFPVLWYQNQFSPKPVAITTDDAPASAERKAYPNDGFILMYAEKAGEVRLSVQDLQVGSAYTGYRVYSPRGNTAFSVVKEGLFYKGNEITFTATANTPYYLRIVAHGIVPAPALNYKLQVSNANLSQGIFEDNTLYLQKANAPLQIFISGKQLLSAQENGSGVLISTQTEAQASRSLALKQLSPARVSHVMDSGWRFQTDPQKVGLQQKFSEFDYDDRSWKTIAVTDWLQNQGFSTYHGTAWYRKNFNMSSLPKGKVFLFFGAIDGDATIYLNGQKIGEHSLGKDGSGWNEPINIEITGKIRAGKNSLAVQVSKEEQLSGIYKGAAVIVKDQ